MKPVSTRFQSEAPQKPWRQKAQLPKYVMKNLYEVQGVLDKAIRQRLGLMIEVPVFIKDPLVALEDPYMGVQEILLRREVGMGNGPTSSRVAVVDFNYDTQTLLDPVEWDDDQGWFHVPATNPEAEGKNIVDFEWLPDAPPKHSKNKNAYEIYIEKVIRNPYFHQVNVWAVVQRVLEFYEEPIALGRPVPWGFDGNRLLVIPHAGYGETAFYDRESKSLQFFYFGDQEHPKYTCLSHDIIAHLTGQAILDGIRPMYYRLPSLQTAAFHEFIGDLTAVLMASYNEDIRHVVSRSTEGRSGEANVLANLASEFAREVVGRDYLRTAFNQFTLQELEIQDSLSPHAVSMVMTGAMWDILIGIATEYLEENISVDTDDANVDDQADASTGVGRKVTPAQAFWWAVDRFRRIAFQPLDLCPPCDIQFIDYAKAVIRNDVLTNPMDERGYRPLMLDVFHRRGLCSCGYEPGRAMSEGCQFWEALHYEKLDFVFLDPERLSRSKTAASYFLNDNLNLLRIPPDKNFRIVDLYTINKYGAGAEMLPSEIVLEYAWQEEVILAEDQRSGLDFGQWNGKSINLDCGGTLVFDNRGEVLSWFRNPGTEYPPREVADDIWRRLAAWRKDPSKAKIPNNDELVALQDLEIGRQRKKAILEYLSALIQEGNPNLMLT